MLKSRSQQIVTTGLFLAVGLILPWVTSHAFGIPGVILLPMHIPVLLCGLICGPRYGAASGVIIPVLSCLLTGMPAAYPMLPIMAVQLLMMGAVSGLMHEKWKLPLYPSLLLAMASGWIFYGLTFAFLMFAGGSELRALSVTAAILRGIPGIAVQLVLIPILIAALNRYTNRRKQAASVEDDTLLTEALSLIKGGDVSCVVIRDGAIIHTADGRGVSPLLKLYQNEPDTLKNAFVVDKIIGKAAAMLLVLGGASRAYGMVMSVAGRDYLEQRGLLAEHGRCVDVISNRSQTGICPIEKSVLDTDDPEEGLAKMTSTIQELMKQVI